MWRSWTIWGRALKTCKRMATSEWVQNRFRPRPCKSRGWRLREQSGNLLCQLTWRTTIAKRTYHHIPNRRQIWPQKLQKYGLILLEPTSRVRRSRRPSFPYPKSKIFWQWILTKIPHHDQKQEIVRSVQIILSIKEVLIKSRNGLVMRNQLGQGGRYQWMQKAKVDWARLNQSIWSQKILETFRTTDFASVL